MPVEDDAALREQASAVSAGRPRLGFVQQAQSGSNLAVKGVRECERYRDPSRERLVSGFVGKFACCSELCDGLRKVAELTVRHPGGPMRLRPVGDERGGS